MSGPLRGLKVLDFTRLLPGPFGTMILADLGAEVWRVEGTPDLLMVMPPYDEGLSTAHRQINRNKRSLSLDLKHPRGPEVVKRLAAHADVVIEQFRPGVMERLGVGYEALRAVNPKLIYCSITGYGQDGPYRDRAGHDINYLALSGLMSFTGRRADGPSPAGFQVADQCSGGQNAVIAILAALFHRDRAGEGQYLDISMTDGAVHLGAIYAAVNLNSGETPGREGTMLNGGGYYDYYATRDGEYLAVGGLEPQFFRAMVTALGRDDLMCKHMALGADGDYLKDELKKEFQKRTRAEWEEIFRPVDACVEPVLSVAEAMKHPHLRARGMVVEVEKPGGKKLRQLAAPFKFSATPCEYNFVGPNPGAHTAEVLGQAGFSAAEIEELKSQKVVK